METIEIEVTRTDEYKILIDPRVWTKEAIKNWSDVFVPAETSEDIAKHLAGQLMYLGIGSGFIEGFGYVKVFDKERELIEQFKGNERIGLDDYCKGLEVFIVSFNDEYETEILHPIM